MEIKILHMIEGAKQAEGLAVIIDVFRAFSFACYAMNNGAETILPVGNQELAYQLKKENPEYILAGERHGRILEGFDYGNSPSQIEHVDFTGKTIIHTTSAGTQGIDNAKNASQIVTGSLVNAKAIAAYIRKHNFQTVSLICMGWEALRPTEEDTLCAEYIKAMLEGKELDLEKGIAHLKVTSGAKFFDKAQQDVFPERDFFLCTQANLFDFVLEVEKNRDGLNRIRKIECR